jgi:thiamine transport system ATP-binding protein
VVRDGALATPWGRLPLDPGTTALPEGTEVTVVLRSAGLLVASEGPIRGRVSARRFRGDHVLLAVAVGDAPSLHVEAREGELPTVGDAIVLQVAPAGVHVIAETRALPSGV